MPGVIILLGSIPSPIVEVNTVKRAVGYLESTLDQTLVNLAGIETYDRLLEHRYSQNVLIPCRIYMLIPCRSPWKLKY